ncbi:hypothetical protein M1139_01960 [Candidatus Parvarchaeota archaeon]|nr:hypothetical protein [Candidatus Parvarchaeota archaeon]
MKVINVRSVYEEIRRNKPRIDSIIRYVKRGDISGFTPPSTIVGEANYPNVSLGVLFTNDQNAQAYDSPKYWVENKYDVKSIFLAKTLLVNARDRVNVKNVDSAFIQKAALATMAEKEVQLDMQISKVSQPNLDINEFSPHAIAARLEKLSISDNVRIDRRIERVYYDKDLKATDGIGNLYSDKIDENKISRILSVGGMGVKRKLVLSISDNVRIDRRIERVYYDKDLKATDGIGNLYSDKIDENKISRILSVGGMGVKRKLVPTKWAITAVDDTIGKQFIEEIKTYRNGESYGVISGEFLGNRFTFIFIKGCWSFELLETWNRNASEVMFGDGDYELFQGRKEYVKNTAGAYYAIRLAVLEKLREMKSQFSVLCVREITPEYFAPLGVWVVR